MELFRPKLHSALVVVWLTLSVAGVVMSALTWRRLSQSVNSAVKMSNFNDALDRVFSGLLDAETGQRGYTITGIVTYLDPFEDAQRRLPRELEGLSTLSMGDRELQREVVNLRVLAELRMTQLREVVEARRRQGFPAAAALVSLGKGKATMDQIRAAVDRMRRQRLNILTSHGELTRRQLNRANLTSIVAGSLGVGAGLFAFYLARLSFEHELRERELAESKVRAEQKSERKSEFLANMSHEIRTPMNAIIGFTDLLATEVREPRQQRYLASIRTASELLLRLINDVLDMSKIEAGLIVLNPEPTDPREIREFLHSVFNEQAARRGLKLNCDTAEDLPRGLLLDRTRLRQMLVNLVGNAVKFTERGFVRAHVKSEPQSGSRSRVTLLIEVEDTGIGIPQDRLDQIFKPFVQADPGRRQEKEGTGLGLAIVKRLTEVMGGTVSVASVIGQGTTFHLRIPDVTISARLPPMPRPETEARLDFNELRPAILVVVDDNAVNRELIAELFEQTHHTLHFGVNGHEALALTRSLKPDAVLLDIRMPLLDGRKALTQIRQTPGLELVPVVAITASELSDDERELRGQFSGYLRKPFTRRALFDELAQFLPRTGERVTEAGGEPLPPGTAGTPTAQWAELAVELHKLESADWPAVRESAAINEVRSFAARLRELGEPVGCSPLLRYADRLQYQAESYDVAALETELARFPKVVSEIEGRTV